MRQLEQLVRMLPRSRIVVSEEDYLHAELRSRFCGFVDDLEAFLDPENECIHLRSASRAGFYDFGVNRRRVNFLRSRFESSPMA